MEDVEKSCPPVKGTGNKGVWAFLVLSSWCRVVNEPCQAALVASLQWESSLAVDGRFSH